MYKYHIILDIKDEKDRSVYPFEDMRNMIAFETSHLPEKGDIDCTMLLIWLGLRGHPEFQQMSYLRDYFSAEEAFPQHSPLFDAQYSQQGMMRYRNRSLVERLCAAKPVLGFLAFLRKVARTASGWSGRIFHRIPA